MLMPKRTKHRKTFRLPYEGKAKGNTELHFGTYGLMAKEGAWITANQIEAARFYDHYESNGWKVGKNPMKDWKATIRNWERNDYSGTARGSDPYDIRNQYWDESDPTVH